MENKLEKWFGLIYIILRATPSINFRTLDPFPGYLFICIAYKRCLKIKYPQIYIYTLTSISSLTIIFARSDLLKRCILNPTLMNSSSGIARLEQNIWICEARLPDRLVPGLEISLLNSLRIAKPVR